MMNQARWLFGIAAGFNFVVAAGLTVGRPLLAPIVRMDTAAGTNAMLIDLAGVLIAAFGYGYARAAANPDGFRQCISLGVVGKLLVVAVALAHFLAGDVAWPLPALASGDLLFAALFLQFLRRHRGSHRLHAFTSR